MSRLVRQTHELGGRRFEITPAGAMPIVYLRQQAMAKARLTGTILTTGLSIAMEAVVIGYIVVHFTCVPGCRLLLQSTIYFYHDLWVCQPKRKKHRAVLSHQRTLCTVFHSFKQWATESINEEKERVGSKQRQKQTGTLSGR